MKKFHKKSLVLLVCVAMLLTFTVSGTVAFLADNSGPVTNVFTPVEVDTKIVENEDFSTTHIKKSIAVLNNPGANHIPVYVRVAIVGYWVDSSGNIVAPWNGSVAYNQTNWERGSDGYYYYKGELAVGVTTENLLASGETISQPTNKPEGADHLVVTVVHQAIQSQPDAAIKAAWGEAALGYVK